MYMDEVRGRQQAQAILRLLNIWREHPEISLSGIVLTMIVGNDTAYPPDDEFLDELGKIWSDRVSRPGPAVTPPAQSRRWLLKMTPMGRRIREWTS